MSLRVKIGFKNPNMMKDLKGFITDFDGKLKDTHRKWVLMVDEYIVKYSRLDTGRSRGAWTPFMVNQGVDYTRSMPVGGDPAAFAEGQAEGSFLDQDFHTELVNNVEYVEVMDRRYGMFGYSPTENIAFGGFRTEATRGRARKVYAVSNLGNRINRAPSFADKIAYFEGFAQVAYGKFLDNAQKAFDKSKEFRPDVISPVVNEPPMNP